MPLFIVLFVALLASPCFAAEQKAQTTRIVTDQDAGEILFIVNGKTVAVLDEEGMIVFGKVRYREPAKGNDNPAQRPGSTAKTESGDE